VRPAGETPPSFALSRFKGLRVLPSAGLALTMPLTPPSTPACRDSNRSTPRKPPAHRPHADLIPPHASPVRGCVVLRCLGNTGPAPMGWAPSPLAAAPVDAYLPSPLAATPVGAYSPYP